MRGCTEKEIRALDKGALVKTTPTALVSELVQKFVPAKVESTNAVNSCPYGALSYFSTATNGNINGSEVFGHTNAAATVESCALECARTVECRSFQWQERHRMCTMTAVANTHFVLPTWSWQPKHEVYTKLSADQTCLPPETTGTVTPTICHCNCTALGRYEEPLAGLAPSSNIETHTVRALNDCARKCTREMNCMAFQWHKGDLNCRLKTRKFDTSDLQAAGDWWLAYRVYNKITGTHCCRCVPTSAEQ